MLRGVLCTADVLRRGGLPESLKSGDIMPPGVISVTSRLKFSHFLCFSDITSGRVQLDLSLLVMHIYIFTFLTYLKCVVGNRTV